MSDLAPGLRDSLVAATEEFASRAASLAERGASISEQQAWLSERERELQAQLAELRPDGGSSQSMVALDEEGHIDFATRTIRVSGTGAPSANGLYTLSGTHNGAPQWNMAGTVRRSPAARPLGCQSLTRFRCRPPQAWRIYWPCAPPGRGWVLGEGHSVQRHHYHCEVDERLGRALGRWANRRAMEAVLATQGEATELYKDRWHLVPRTADASDTFAFGGGVAPVPVLSVPPPSFIESSFTSRVDYEDWLREQPA